MQEPNLLVIVILVLSSSLMLLAALYLLAKFSTLFRNSIRNELLRRNLVVWLIATCLILALTPTNQDFYKMLSSMKLVHYFLLQLGCVALEALFVFNVTCLIADTPICLMRPSAPTRYTFQIRNGCWSLP